MIGKKLRVTEGIFALKEVIFFNISQVIINFLAWSLIAPTLDILIYSEPANKVFLQGIITSISNSLTVGILGTHFLLKAYASTRVKKIAYTRNKPMNKPIISFKDFTFKYLTQAEPTFEKYRP